MKYTQSVVNSNKNGPKPAPRRVSGKFVQWRTEAYRPLFSLKLLGDSYIFNILSNRRHEAQYAQSAVNSSKNE